MQFSVFLYEGRELYFVYFSFKFIYFMDEGYQDQRCDIIWFNLYSWFL